MAISDTLKVKGHRVFRGTFCSLIALEIELKKDELRIEELWTAMGVSPPPRRFRNTCGSGSESTDFHLHLTWNPTPEGLSVAVEFAHGHRPPEKNERPPLAEDFFEWLRQFVVINEAMADVHSDFEYPAKSGRRIGFLPLRARIGSHQEVYADIDGISFRPSPSPEGIEKLWVTQGEDELTVHLHAERKIKFAGFDARHHVLALGGALDSLFESNSSKKEN